MRTPLVSTIGADVLTRITGQRVVGVGFGAGPGAVAVRMRRCEPPVGLDEALALLEPRRDTFRRAHVELDDGTRLWFVPDGFLRIDVHTS